MTPGLRFFSIKSVFKPRLAARSAAIRPAAPWAENAPRRKTARVRCASPECVRARATAVPTDVLIKLAAAALVAFAFPVSWKAIERIHAAQDRPSPRASVAFGVAAGVLLFAAIKAMNREAPSPFLYFNF